MTTKSTAGNCGNNQLFEVSDPCALLGQLRAAYYILLAGEQTASISFGSRQMTYRSTDAATLRVEIDRLEQICPQSEQNPRPMSGYSTSVVARAMGRR